MDSTLELKWRNRIAVRIAGGVLLVTAAALGMVGWLTAVQEARLFQEAHTLGARKTSAVIATRTAERMLAGGGHSTWTETAEEASRLARESGTLRIFVLSTRGEIRADSDPAGLNTAIRTAANPDCPGCDSKNLSDFPAAATIRAADGRARLRIVNAVPASSQCVSCHPEASVPLGFVVSDFDLGPLLEASEQRRATIAVIGAVFGAALFAVIFWLFRRSVMDRVEQVIAAAARLSAGDTSARAPVSSQDEMGLLARQFNTMAGRLEDQIAGLEAANLETGLLYSLVVEVSRNMEMSDVALAVVKVLRTKLHPRRVAFFADTGVGGWVCAAGDSEQVVSAEGELREALETSCEPGAQCLEGFPGELIAQALQTGQAATLMRDGEVKFALPLMLEGRLEGLLACDAGALRVRIRTAMIENLGAHLGLAVENSRHYMGAVTDTLTRMRSKRYGMARLDEAIFDANRQRHDLALIMLDIDHFKRVNDTYGHVAGDQALREIARRLLRSVRKSDVPVRYGGEEFMIILTWTGAVDLQSTAERMCSTVAAAPITVHSGSASFTVTISAGATLLLHGVDTPELLIERADRALYRAKAAGRNRVEVDHGAGNPDGAAGAAT
jgi:diguanylate cyclase (GGDEF)-like protein